MKYMLLFHHCVSEENEYHWPGNVREVESFMECAVILSAPLWATSSSPLRTKLRTLDPQRGQNLHPCFVYSAGFL